VGGKVTIIGLVSQWTRVTDLVVDPPMRGKGKHKGTR